MTTSSPEKPRENTPSDQPPNAPVENQKRDKKDFWDRFSSMSTSIATVLVAIVGLVFTVLFNARQGDVQKTQTVAQLMPYLSSADEKQQRMALIAVKVLRDTKLMVDLAASDSKSRGAREALRDVAFNADDEKDRAIALNVLRWYEFALPCSLPFQDIAVKHPIDQFDQPPDQSCGMFGTGPDVQRIQNEVKNNFCAGTGYRDVTTADFKVLQQKAASHVAVGNPSVLPRDRSVLKPLSGDLGEGSAVQFTGYVLIARQEGPESVNCQMSGNEMNDIHVSLVSKADETDECQSIVTEISPHMRPAKWNPATLQQLATDKVRVRVAGQLMFDASHAPCGDSKRPGPKRLSSWEIHPVYSIEVCPVAGQGACPENKWEPLERPPQQK